MITMIMMTHNNLDPYTKPFIALFSFLLLSQIPADSPEKILAGDEVIKVNDQIVVSKL